MNLLPNTRPMYTPSRPGPGGLSGLTQHNGYRPALQQAQDIQQLLLPVQPGLQRVEQKMKGVEKSIFAPLADAFVELIGSGGKRLRPALALMAAEFHDPLQETGRYDQVLSLAAAVEMLHTATLVHDDVIDGALLRRGAPTLNASWSQGATVLAGDFLFARAAQFAAETENMRVIRIFSDTLQTIVDGELRQLLALNNYHQEREEYYERIYAKTASLFSAATEAAAAISGLPEERIQQLKAFGYHLGMAFQIMDDILDFIGDDATLGKPAGSDLRQGTLTLPFFYFLRSHPAPPSVIQQLEDARTEADFDRPDRLRETVAGLVEEIRRSDAVESARMEAVTFLDRAATNLQGLPDNIYRQSMLGLCAFVVQRSN